jgi:hypothetical protein
MMLSGDQQLL